MKTQKFWLWAIPAGHKSRLHEMPLTSFALTRDQADKVKSAARRDGWHSFRLAPDNNDVPDFASAVKL